jgi:hypothetical protein
MEIYLQIFGVVLALAILIAFFIMAYNIVKMRDDLKYIREISFLFAYENDLLTEVKCKQCGHIMQTTFPNESYICPECNTPNEPSKE